MATLEDFKNLYEMLTKTCNIDCGEMYCTNFKDGQEYAFETGFFDCEGYPVEFILDLPSGDVWIK